MRSAEITAYKSTYQELASVNDWREIKRWGKGPRFQVLFGDWIPNNLDK